MLFSFSLSSMKCTCLAKGASCGHILSCGHCLQTFKRTELSKEILFIINFNLKIPN